LGFWGNEREDVKHRMIAIKLLISHNVERYELSSIVVVSSSA